MRAAQIIGRGRVVLREIDRPKTQPGHILIRSLLVAICGSDLRKVYHLPESEYPLEPGVAGHEIVGVVEEIGSSESSGNPNGVRVGDTVLGLIPVIENGMAEFYLTASENVLPLPVPAAALDRAAMERLLMAQQLGTVVYACRRIGPVRGKTAVVIGQGSAGLFFDAMLKRLGAARVIALDVVDARVSAGRSFGADEAINTRNEDPRRLVASITDGRMADLVIEAVGEPATINLAAHLVASEGELLYFGVPHEPEFRFDYDTFYRKYCRTTSTGSSGLEPGKPSYREALEIIASGEIDVSAMVTHRYPLDEVEAAYRRAFDRSDGAIKVIVEIAG